MAPVNAAEVDALAQTLTDTTAALTLLLKGGLALPAAWRDKPAPVEVRRAAYVKFQEASIRSFTTALNLPEFAQINQKPVIAGGPWPWSGTAKALDVMAAANRDLSDLLAATANVRMVGGPGPVRGAASRPRRPCDDARFAAGRDPEGDAGEESPGVRGGSGRVRRRDH